MVITAMAAERAFAVGFERINEGLVELTKESYAKYRKLLWKKIVTR